MNFFELQHTDAKTGARAGVIHTAHGDILTPVFMPVGTQATVKTLDSFDLEKINAQIILGNNYHLHLRPGEDLVAKAGGLHKFMNWDKPILTDSGGFQVFSLGLSLRGAERRGNPAVSKTNSEIEGIASSPRRNVGVPRNDNEQTRLVKIDEEGVTFRSHIDGSTHRFTPESAIECQHKIGADIIMAFDECTPDASPYDYARQAMERTHRWAKRCLTYHQQFSNLTMKQFLFGIIQGANHRDLREQSAQYISSLDFDGIAIGGESIGYNMPATAEILDWVAPLIPKNKPHYAMGIGLNPSDLIVAIEHGVDMFDCVAPTRLARHGMLFCHCEDPDVTSGDAAIPSLNKHRLNIKNKKFEADLSPIDKTCDCSTCQNYTRAYLHHLFAADEMTALRLASIHNLRVMIKLMEETRAAILADKFEEIKKKWL